MIEVSCVVLDGKAGEGGKATDTSKFGSEVVCSIEFGREIEVVLESEDCSDMEKGQTKYQDV